LGLSFRARLVLGALVATVPVAVALADSYRRERDRQHGRVPAQVERASLLVAAGASGLLAEVRQDLVRLSLLPAVRDAHPSACAARLARTVSDRPWLVDLVRVGPTGAFACSARPPAASWAWAGRAELDSLHQARRFEVGGHRRLFGTDAFVAAVPVLRQRSSRWHGVLVAAVDGQALGASARRLPRSPEETWAVVDRAGRVLASSPDLQPGQVLPLWKWVGPDGVADEARISGLAWQQEGGYARPAGYAVAWAPVYEGGLYAIWAVPEAVAFREVREAGRRTAVGLVVGALVAAVLSWLAGRWLVLKPIAALAEATSRVRAGDLRARTGLPHDATEVGRLAETFDRMVEALQARESALASAYDTTLEGWSRALELRDRETRGHTLRVTAMAVELARAMGVDEDQITHLRRGALLHDIGKMAIPDEILHKPGPLSPEEMAVMRRHPQYAYELLWPIAYLRPALGIPYCHHERWDGSGYPRGLRAEEIPLAARIFAVVDVWDALRSSRPYRPAWPEDRVRAYLREQAGRQFDPKVVEAFLRMLEGRPADG
jgi:putative nucleotidyltransferase with HDIG domain